jgi:hypothetical protein
MYLKKLSFEGARHIKTIALLSFLAVAAAMLPRIASAEIFNQAVIGWDGDRNGVIAKMDGSYKIRLYALRYDPTMPTPTPAPSPKTIDVSFGIYSNPTPAPSPQSLNWYNKEGYLPCLVTNFTQDSCTVTIENFGDSVQLTVPPSLGSHPYVLIYSRVTITNDDPAQRSHTLCPAPSVSPLGPNAGLVSLTSRDCMVAITPGQTVHDDYVIAADRFGHNEYPWPTRNILATANGGSWDTAYAHMSNYWNAKLSHVTNIVQLPDLVPMPDAPALDSRLKNAYKAGYIYTHIVKDGNELMVGEDIYDDGQGSGPNAWYDPFYTDKLGILATLLTIGDPDALTYLQLFPTDVSVFPPDQYAVARWQYPWLWAIYLEKTNDTAHVPFNTIKAFAHNIHDDRCLMENQNHWDCDQPFNRLMRKTHRELGTTDYWSIDDWSGLMGLSSYKYICDALACDECASEATWASNEYNDLLNAVNTVHQQTINSYTPPLNYLPINMVKSNCESLPQCYWDGNWAVVLSFGRWAWDAYLLGAYQNPTGVEIGMLDVTYAFGLQGAEAHGLGSHNFGAYASDSYSTAYNAGYGSAGLRGEIYRSEGIHAYQFILDNGQTGPYSWLESFKRETAPGPWVGVHPTFSHFVVSCPHMFGQSTATKVLVDSLIALKVGSAASGDAYGVVIGRGVPNEWITGGRNIEVSNFPIENNKRMGFKLATNSGSQSFTLDLTGDAPGNLGALLDLRALKRNILSVIPDSIPYDYENGTVTIPSGSGVTHITVNLQRPNPTPVPTPTPAPEPSCSPPCSGGLWGQSKY